MFKGKMVKYAEGKLQKKVILYLNLLLDIEMIEN